MGRKSGDARKDRREGTEAGGARSLKGLKVLAFGAGAVIMSLEIVGSRLLAPHFGNSVFVWGSLITVFLAALAGGYLIGGIVADRRPSFVLLNGLCLAAAVLIAVIPWAGHPLCAALLGVGLREQSGPLVAASLLFLPASVVLGMVSPFSVRLATSSVQSVGRSAGTLYALSTLGSIVGTLLTTFVLVPNIGVGTILKALAAVMLLLPVALLVGEPRRLTGLAPLLVVGSLALALPVARAASLEPGEELVLDEATPYHQLSVIDLPHQRARVMKFDRFIETSIDLEPPHRTRSAYTDYFQLAFLAQPEMKRALFIGAGGGVGPRAFASVDPQMEIDVVDIDGRVLEAARELFHMPETDRIRSISRDGRTFLQTTDELYDCIVLDAFTIGGRIPFHLATREAFEACRARLAPGGVFVMNVSSALEGERSGIHHAMTRTLSDVFPGLHGFVSQWATDQDRETTRNVIFVATASDPMPQSEWLARVDAYPAHALVTRPAVRTMVGEMLTELPEVSELRPFTDELAPIETMSF